MTPHPMSKYFGDREKEKLHFNRKKALTEPGSGLAAICHDQLW